MNRSRMLCLAGVAVVWLLPSLSWRTSAQEVPAQPRSTLPYDAVEAGAEAQRKEEQQRLEAIRRQLGLIEDLKSRAGLTSWYGGPAYTFRPYSVEYLYALGAARNDRSPGRTSGGLGTLFERWPYVPGDLWGYSPDRPVRQSIGQRQVQVNPHRWESFPVYADTDVTPAVPPAPQPIPPPPQAESGGPREF